MPPLFRIDVGKEVYYALDEGEKQGILDRIEAEKKRGKVNVQRFKGLGEMMACLVKQHSGNTASRNNHGWLPEHPSPCSVDH